MGDLFSCVTSDLPSRLSVPKRRCNSLPDISRCPGYMPFYPRRKYVPRSYGRQPFTSLSRYSAASAPRSRRYPYKPRKYPTAGSRPPTYSVRRSRGKGSFRIRPTAFSNSIHDDHAAVVTCDANVSRQFIGEAFAYFVQGSTCSGADRFHVGDIRVRVTNITSPSVVAGCYPEKADSDIAQAMSTAGITYTNFTETLTVECDQGVPVSHRRIVVETFLNHADWEIKGAEASNGFRLGTRTVSRTDPSSRFVASLFGGVAPCRWFTEKYSGEPKLREDFKRDYRSGSSAALSATQRFRNAIGGPVFLRDKGAFGTSTPGNVLVVDLFKCGMADSAFDDQFGERVVKPEPSAKEEKMAYEFVPDADETTCCVRSVLSLFWKPPFRRV